MSGCFAVLEAGELILQASVMIRFLCLLYTSTFFPVGQPIEFEGFADAYEVPITAVEISLDKGKTWTTLETPDNDPTCWTYWRLTYTPAEPGAYLLKVRATCTDSEGVEHVASRDTNFLFNVE